MVFLNLTRTLIFSTLLVFFILPERNSIMDNVVLGGNVESISLNYCFDFKWGSEGSANGQFLRPHDVNFDSKGNVYVSDRDRNDIQKFTPNGTFFMKWGSEGNNPGQFNVPYSIEVDPFDNIYVVDRGNDRIQKFDENGKFVKQWGSEGKGNGEFTPLLEHLEVDSKQDRIFMVDGALNPRIQVFDTNGTFTTTFGTSGSGNGQFSKPEHVNTDSSGNVYVVDRGNQRMQVFSKC